MEFVKPETAFYQTALLMYASVAIVYAWTEDTDSDFGTQ